MKVENGHKVHVHYKGTLSDGTEFDNSRVRGEALAFQVGTGRMIPGFNTAVLGMTAGQTKTVLINPDEAYGPRDPAALQKVPREAFDPDFDFTLGGTIQGNGPRGPFLAKIHALEESHVVLDLNHPLAGEELNFEIELVSVEVDSPAVSLGWNRAMKKPQLLELAKAHGLSVNTRSTKAQIIEALETA
jgi:peptidylprolyl isomerase